jgi:regulator of protease activity HflC (stomatin/prohibitin superfamily)
MASIALIAGLAILVVAVIVVLSSIKLIGPTEIGLVTKTLGFRRLTDDNPIAFKGEAGYQAKLLMPGLRFRLWPVYSVKKYPWVQIPAGQIGVVIAQVGEALPIGAKSARFNPAFGNFGNLEGFLSSGGQKGVQRPVLPPGTLVPIHPVGFLVITADQVYGIPVSDDFVRRSQAGLVPESFGLNREQLQVTVISPQGHTDYIGIVTALEGEPLPSGDIASRLGGFDDITALLTAEGPHQVVDAAIIEVLLGSKNELHNNYQDFQRFLDAGGKIGLQHDPLLYGAYLLNPFLVQVELVPMLVVNQGEVAVIKSFVGLPTLDTSGAEFKFGSIVRPGHRGIWQEPLRTGKYPINPRVYAAEIVPTSILTLNWSSTVSQAHSLDANLGPIHGKSREGFIFTIELQVQIHVPDTRAPKVISMVGTMLNLVNEVLQSAVGNHFRNTLQDLEAVRFIETRMAVQRAALEAVRAYLADYEVETRGVYIQDVVFPEELVVVLTQREIANQEKATFQEEERAQTVRIEMERAKGTADMQAQLASAQVNVEISRNGAAAREAEAQGEAAYVQLTGEAEAARTQAIGLAQAKATEALGLARAEGYQAQVQAIGSGPTAMVAVANSIAEGHVDIMPQVLVTGGSTVDGLAASLMQFLQGGSSDGGGSGGNGATPDGGSADALTAGTPPAVRGATPPQDGTDPGDPLAPHRDLS